MSVLVEPLLDRAQSRAVDRALADRGMQTALLMENAGRGAAEHVARVAIDRGIAQVDIVCGPGNNGGDGLVVARHLALRGLSVRVLALHDPSLWKGDAAIMLDALFASDPSVAVLRADEQRVEAPLVVDALFGTGLRSALDERAESIVASFADRTVIALDIPSGIDADTGAPLGPSVRASLTLTFGTSKPGLHTGEGRVHAGEVRVVSLGARAPIEGCSRWLVRDVRVEPRAIDAHKGTAGRVLILGGSRGTVGAGWLSALGAHRAGAGLVTFATRAGVVEPRVIETMVLALSDHNETDAHLLREQCARTDVVVVGPGLGRDDWARAMLDHTLASTRCAVIDGDALTLLAARDRSLPCPRVVLTPHPLEAARLLHRASADEINVDRVSAARAIAQRYQSVCVLKGAGTVIAHPDGRVWVVDIAEPTLAIAGSGDVLAGVIAARLADRERDAIQWHEAAIEGVWAHARAGQRVRARRRAVRGALAHELADEVGPVLDGAPMD